MVLNCCTFLKDPVVLLSPFVLSCKYFGRGASARPCLPLTRVSVDLCNVHCRPNRVVSDGSLFAFGFLWKTNKFKSNCHQSLENQTFHSGLGTSTSNFSHDHVFICHFISKYPSRTPPMRRERWRRGGGELSRS